MRGLVAVFIFLISFGCANAAVGVRLKDLARIDGAHDNALVGYGIVVGLAGSGDSSRNRATLQSVANTLANFGVRVSDSDLNSRNTAAVIVTSTLSAFAEPGDQVDVQVASLGDAKSLAGGTLVLTPLYGPDQQLYALSQGPLAVGGYKVESYSDSIQKNYPTVGRIPRGAIIERGAKRAASGGIGENANLAVILNQPDYTTAQRLIEAIQAELGFQAKVIHPGKVEIQSPQGTDMMNLIARVENVRVSPDHGARVVINERTGTVVAGSQVRIEEVSIVHGDLQIAVTTEYLVSQPQMVGRQMPGVSTEVVPDTKIDVSDREAQVVQLQDGTTVGDLVRALQRINVSTRDVISILQSVKTAGALHAELVIQ